MKKDLESIKLTTSELHIMKVAWKKGEVTVRDVLNIISRTKKVAYTTISTEMANLEKKGALVRSKKIYINYYKPLLSRQQAIRSHLKYLIENYFDDNSEELLEFIFQNMYDLKDMLSIMYSKGWHHSLKSVN
jgi:predicted transcriptional regulator